MWKKLRSNALLTSVICHFNLLHAWFVIFQTGIFEFQSFVCHWHLTFCLCHFEFLSFVLYTDISQLWHSFWHLWLCQLLQWQQTVEYLIMSYWHFGFYITVTLTFGHLTPDICDLVIFTSIIFETLSIVCHFWHVSSVISLILTVSSVKLTFLEIWHLSFLTLLSVIWSFVTITLFYIFTVVTLTHVICHSDIFDFDFVSFAYYLDIFDSYLEIVFCKWLKRSCPVQWPTYFLKYFQYSSVYS